MESSGTTETAKKGDVASVGSLELKGFKKRLSTSCPRCGYKGIMGWNRYRVSSGMATLMVLSIPVGMVIVGLLFGVILIGGFLIFVPAILLRLAFQRYYAQCPQCKEWLMLKKSQVSDVGTV
jgi:DNA-directed RNA polymerase subunit RPC12/RpoP